jgi:hypothetical protein
MHFLRGAIQMYEPQNNLFKLRDYTVVLKNNCIFCMHKFQQGSNFGVFMHMTHVNNIYKHIHGQFWTLLPI